MALEDRLRWNARYGEGPPPGLTPYPFLLEAAERGWLPPGGRALDLACGRGDEAVWLARAGFVVDAVDISDTALAQGLDRAETADVADRVRLIEADLDEGLPAEAAGPYDLICAFRFRAPVVGRAIGSTLRSMGVVLTSRLSAVGRPAGAQPGQGQGPDPRFLATEGELLTLAGGFELEVWYHREAEGEARLAAWRPGTALG